jgi:hypothetical protein
MIFLPEMSFERRIAQNLFFHSGGRRLRKLNLRYLPECISGAVTESRIYRRVGMKFTDLHSLTCGWNQWTKPSAQSKTRKMSLFLIQPWSLQFDSESFRG